MPTPCSYRRAGRHRRQLLRRRRHRRGRLRREPEFRRPEAAADPVRLRKQRLRHPHATRAAGRATPAICERARAHGMPAERIDGNDVLRPAASGAARSWPRIRAGAGPWFFEVMTYRWREHVGPNCDYHLGYRTRGGGRAVDRPTTRCAGWPSMLDARRAGRHRGGGRSRDRRRLRLRRGQPVPGAGRTATRDVFKEERSCIAVRAQRRHGQAALPGGRRASAHAVLRRGRPRGDRSGDGARSGRRPVRSGRGRSQGDPGDHARPGREVRPGARLRHAAVRRRHDRGRHRHGPGRPAADPRPHPHGFPDAGHEPARQRRRQEPLHVRRPGRACRWWCAP